MVLMVAPIVAKAVRFQTGIKTLVISGVDLGQVPDGVHAGACDLGAVVAEVRVTVRDHVITAIDLVKHVNGRGGAASAIPGKVVQAQSLEVDVITGATYSSKVILKAIENALTAR
jgi:uncharacterized protein with FMN-binding domain